MSDKRYSYDTNEEERRLAPVQAEEGEIEEFPELITRIGRLLPDLIRAILAGDAGRVEEIVYNYVEYVTENYSDHELYGFTPAIVTHSPLDLAAMAHNRGFHDICGILYNEECPVIGAAIDAAAE